MNFIVTAIGHELHMSRPEPGHITALTVAWSLSQINRFNGHCIRPYSVAEHSLLVCEIAERELGANVFCQLGALMHDAHEAFCSRTARFLGGFGKPFCAQPFDGSGFVAVVFDERSLRIHHACARFLTQLFY
jgi:hypothetical protein